MSVAAVLEFETIDSTNAYFKRTWADQPTFAFAFASHQTAGKGRGERHWSDVEGDNVLFSLLIKEPTALSYGPMLGLVAAVAVSELLEEHGLKDVAIKWPNDVYVGGKKIAGILLEGSLPSYLVIGVGVNVNQTRFDGEYRVTPTSYALESGKTLDLGTLKEEIVAKVSSFLLEGPFVKGRFLSYYSLHDYLKGKIIRRDDRVYEVLGIDEEFGLVCRDEKGKENHFVSGEMDLL